MCPDLRHTAAAGLLAAAILWNGAQVPSLADTEALSWNTEGQRDVTLIYGEITVLASIPNIYFCGVQWDGVGGYCGIQHNGPAERRTIFSIWDTSPTLHPRVTAADAQTLFNRFGGEGEGAHTHLVWNWKYEEPFRFVLRKEPGKAPDTTDTRFYFFDPVAKWRHEATINSPNGKHARGSRFEGIVSWIENFAGQNFSKPKIALYSLWIGSSPDNLKHLTRSGGESGSGRWGQLRNTYFLAEGSAKELAAAFSGLEAKYGKPTYGKDGQELAPIPTLPLPAATIEELKHLPNAPSVP